MTSIAGQIDLGALAWLHELRDAHGRWTRGSPGPGNPKVAHLMSALPFVEQAEHLGLYDDVSGAQGTTRIITRPSGEKIIDKWLKDPADADREELASYVAQSLGAPAPAIYRAGPHRILEEHIPGKVAARHFGDVIDSAKLAAMHRGIDEIHAIQEGVVASEDERDRIFATPEARALADFDWMITNDDRHEFNWIVRPDGRPVGIDHGYAMFDGMPMEIDPDDDTDNEFFQRNDPMTRHFPPADVTSPADPRAVAFRQRRAAHAWDLAERLHAVEPEFARLGHQDWFDNMISYKIAEMIDPANPDRAYTQIMAHWGKVA